ncbi:cysteine desulfurase family protein [Sinorhizobium fredii]|uniref:cysteine desulfurase family protein n=1 Tax=Rhizobium fredii TaxID=380 RepID=UPI0035185988
MTIYLDANATVCQLPEVARAVHATAALGPLNASSAHSRGDAARLILSEAKEAVCDALGGDDPENIIFVSGGTEANNIIINGLARLGAPMIATAVEHASVVEPVLAYGGTLIGVNSSGVLCLAALRQALNEAVGAQPVLVCVQAANSETGVIQPLVEIAELCAEYSGKVYLHVDAAQAFGRMPLSLTGIDSIAVSGHKFHAPLGSGFLYLSDRLADVLPRSVLGGGQERGFRSGTQNVPAIAGLDTAVRMRFARFEEIVSELTRLRDFFERLLLSVVPDARIIASKSARLPNTSNIMFRDVDALALMANLDGAGVICSNGSACSSMKPSPSRVLREMGLTESEAFSCLRFSFSEFNTLAEIELAVTRIAEAFRKLKALR